MRRHSRKTTFRKHHRQARGTVTNSARSTTSKLSCSEVSKQHHGFVFGDWIWRNENWMQSIRSNSENGTPRIAICACKGSGEFPETVDECYESRTRNVSPSGPNKPNRSQNSQVMFMVTRACISVSSIWCWLLICKLTYQQLNNVMIVFVDSSQNFIWFITMTLNCDSNLLLRVLRLLVL